jgi:hypothetical protein
MREYNEVLVRKLEERNEKVERVRAEVALANEGLERRAEERNAELLLANQELEAFSHSLAHYLRSPSHGYRRVQLPACRGVPRQGGARGQWIVCASSARPPAG